MTPGDTSVRHHPPAPAFTYGTRLLATGSAIPPRVVDNHELARRVDTSDEWIQQRTGIRERRYITQPQENTVTLSRDALRIALEGANLKASDLDLVMIGTCTHEMTVPSTASRVCADFGLNDTGAFDVLAACSGFVYAINIADTLIRSGRYQRIGVIGCDALTNIIDQTERSVSILFGDAAGAAVLERTDDAGRGCLYQTMGGDGTRWDTLYRPMVARDVREWDKANPVALGCLRMQGREVYKFAVKKFQDVIEDALLKTGLAVEDVSQFVCHQSNARIIESAIEKIGLPPDRVLINIDRIGNTSSGSVARCLDELWQAGKIKPGEIIILVAFGAGLTWASSVWRV
jgi:3-oxoacyl-[acyl-carrier-protein] synthase-3